MKILNKKLAIQLSYDFKSPQLLELALTHRSKKKVHDEIFSYERLEFLGDAVLSMVMAQYLYATYPHKQEGQLTRMRATLVREETLVQVAQSLHLGKYLILGAGEVKAGGRQRDSILADVVEAILGAIYLDCDDIKVIEKLVMLWFDEPLKTVGAVDTISTLKDNKSRLQEQLQAQRISLPRYTLSHVTGKAPQEIFTVICDVLTDTDTVMHTAQATGKSRRIAEQNAAKAILALLN